MKKVLLGAIATAVIVSCSTVSSIMQNTFPFNSTIVVTKGSPANTTLSTIGTGTGINQLVGTSTNVKDIRLSNSTVTITNGDHGMGIFKSVKVYLTTGSNEILVASRDNISDNIGNTLALDVDNSKTLDNTMKSGSTVQQKIVYTLKSAPTSDVTLRTTLNFTSSPITQ